MKHKQIEEITMSFINRQRRQGVRQISEYGVVDFWPDIEKFIADADLDTETAYGLFTDMVKSYFRITDRFGEGGRGNVPKNKL